jgi:hypothetical protein
MTRGRAGECRYRVEPSAPQGKPLCGRLWRPCPAAGFAVAGSPEGEVKRMANPPAARAPAWRTIRCKPRMRNSSSSAEG